MMFITTMAIRKRGFLPNASDWPELAPSRLRSARIRDKVPSVLIVIGHGRHVRSVPAFELSVLQAFFHSSVAGATATAGEAKVGCSILVKIWLELFLLSS
jgi:hypothetical protein